MAIENIADLLKSLGHKGTETAPEAAPAPKPAPSTVSAQTTKQKAVKTKKQSAWAKIEASYKRYDPAKEGFGSADEWRGTFYLRMGWEKAMKILEGKSPRVVLGVTETATFEECRSAFRKLQREFHPDRVKTHGHSEQESRDMLEKVNAAYEVLEREHEQELSIG